MNKSQATKLWNTLRDNFLTLDNTLTKIIEAKAWEPLGYATFTEAWADKMSGVRLAGAMEATVVYAMLDAGADATDVALSVSGVGGVKSKAYAQAYGAGMDPAQAARHAASMSRAPRKLGPGETYVAGYIRGQQQKRNSITLRGFTDEQIAEWKSRAESAGMKFSEWASAVFEQAADLVVIEGVDDAA